MSHTPINPLRQRGVVALNACVHGPLNIQAEKSLKPYYQLPEGSAAKCYREVRHLSVLFTVMSADPAVNALMHHNDDAEDNNHVMGVDCLNGLFDGERDNEAIMAKIVPLGIAEVRTPGHKYFNCMRKGVISFQNETDRTIYNGDEGIVYAPNKTEVAGQTGAIRLQVRPFDRLLHSATPKPVYACVRAMMNNDQSDQYMPAYKRMCENFFEGAAGIGLLAMASLGRDKLTDVLGRTGDDVSFATALMAEMKNKAFMSRFNNTLFAQYAEQPQWLDSTAGPQSPLNKAQAKAAGRFMLASAGFNAEVERRKVGKFHSTGLPGQWTMFQVDM